MKNLIIIFVLLLTACVEFPDEQKKETMIKPSIFNAINFSDDFNRESEYFDPQLQRMEGLICPSSACLSFEFTPTVMPESTPGATLFAKLSNGSIAELIETHVTELADRYIYFFLIAYIGLIPGECEFYFQVDGYDEIIYSEKCISYLVDNLASESIVRILAYNSDSSHGYCTSAYPGGGLFRFSELNSNVFGNDKTEYDYSYGRKKILSSENYIKRRFTFVGLSMYQQNLLKTLCNCEILLINSTAYCLVSDFTEKNKDDDLEICDLQAEFVQMSDPTFYVSGATQRPGAIDQVNLFN